MCLLSVCAFLLCKSYEKEIYLCVHCILNRLGLWNEAEAEGKSGKRKKEREYKINKHNIYDGNDNDDDDNGR